MQRETQGPDDEFGRLGWFKGPATYASLFLMAGLTVSTLLEVAIRYSHWLPTHWGGGELPILFLIWSIGLGIACATLTGSHLKLDVISFSRSRRGQALHDLAINIICLLMSGVFAYYALTYSISNIGSRSPSLGISYFFISISLFLGLAISALFYLTRVFAGIGALLGRTGAP